MDPRLKAWDDGEWGSVSPNPQPERRVEFWRPLGREGSISHWHETDNQRLITPRQIIYHYRKSKLRNLNPEGYRRSVGVALRRRAPQIIVDPAIFVRLSPSCSITSGSSRVGMDTTPHKENCNGRLDCAGLAGSGGHTE